MQSLTIIVTPKMNKKGVTIREIVTIRVKGRDDLGRVPFHEGFGGFRFLRGFLRVFEGS